MTLTVTDGTHIPIADEACDAAFSAHVFQHFESHDDALAVFREIHRALAVGGTLMVHLPLYDLPDTRVALLFPPLISFAERLSDLKAALDRKRLLKGEWKPVMRRLRFERKPLLDALQNLGFGQIEFRMFPVQSNGSYHEFVFATKCASPGLAG